MKHRIMVTGASGFIGSHVLAALDHRDAELHGIGRNPSKFLNAGRVNWHQVDLQDSVQTDALMRKVRPDLLIHLAWDTTPGDYWKSIDNIRWLESTLRLVRLFHEYGGERVVGVGSCAEYEWSKGTLVEYQTQLSYQTTYATCKNYAHALLQDYSEKTGLSYAWARLFFLYGPHEQEGRLVPYVINSILTGSDVVLKNGAIKRDYLYVGDAAKALVCLLESSYNGVINIGSGKGIRLDRLAERIADMIPGETEIRSESASFAEEYPLVRASIELIRHQGWSPSTPLDEGIRSAIDWWKKRSGGITTKRDGRGLINNEIYG